MISKRLIVITTSRSAHAPLAVAIQNSASFHRAALRQSNSIVNHTDGGVTRVPRAIRNPKANSRDLVLVNQLCPPQFYLYEPAGYYDRTHGKMKFDVIEKAKKDAPLGNLSMDNELHYNDSDPAVRA